MSIIYGVDTTKKVTPVMVREAIVSCFYDAHCAQLGLVESTSKVDKMYCEQIVRKAFLETGGDYSAPTKGSLVTALPWLANFSKNFRDQDVIEKHMEEIQNLITLLEDK